LEFDHGSELRRAACTDKGLDLHVLHCDAEEKEPVRLPRQGKATSPPPSELLDYSVNSARHRSPEIHARELCVGDKAQSVHAVVQVEDKMRLSTKPGQI